MAHDVPIALASDLNEYWMSEIESENPNDLLLKVYDLAIASCERGDQERARRAVVELITALNFDHKEVATGLYRLYHYVLDCVQKNRLEEGKEILVTLRATWKSALSNSRA